MSCHDIGLIQLVNLFLELCIPIWYGVCLFQILLEDDNFDEALNLLKQVKLDGIQPDVLLFNTVLKQACYKVLHLSY